MTSSTPCADQHPARSRCAGLVPASPPPGGLRRHAVPLLVLEAGLVLAWSSGFLGMRFTVDHAPMALALFWRGMLLTLILLPWAAGALRRAPPKTLLIQAGIGLLAVAGYLAGVGRGIESGVPAGLAALIADLLPIGTAVLGLLVLGQRLSARAWVGLIVGLGGVMLATHDALTLGQAPLWSYALPLLGMISLACATLWIKRAGPAMAFGLVPTLWIHSTVSAPVLGIWALSSHGSLVPIFSAEFILSILCMGLLAGLGGYGLYWICLNRSSPTRVASVLYLSPGATLIGSAFFFGEPLSWVMVAGMAISVCGVAMVVRAND